jgi:phosphatidylglycerol:prolipoprotein diacylglycerol transferase
VFPILIDFGTRDLPFFGETHLFLPSYGFLFALGVVLAWVWFIRRARTLEVPDDRLFNLTFYSLLAGILGAKLLLIIIDWRSYLAHPIEILGTLRSAGVLVGGVVAGSITFVLYGRRQELPLWRLTDAISAPLILAQAVGRLGCFSAGCCWGAPVDPSHPLAVTFTDPKAYEQTGVPLDIARLPTQLIEMGFDLLLAGLLTILWRRNLRPAGSVFWVYVLLYSLGRGVIEFWRDDRHRGLYFGDTVSTSQLFAVAGIVLAVTMLVRGLRMRRQSDASSP